MMEKFLTAMTFFTPGIFIIRDSTSVINASVRASEAPLGSWTSTKTTPWSSFGMKPVGVRMKKNTVRAVETRRISAVITRRAARKVALET